MKGVFMMLRGESNNRIMFSAALPEVNEGEFATLWSKLGALAYRSFVAQGKERYWARDRYEIELNPILDDF